MHVTVILRDITLHWPDWIVYLILADFGDNFMIIYQPSLRKMSLLVVLFSKIVGITLNSIVVDLKLMFSN